MGAWEQKLTYRYAGAHAKMTLLLERASRVPDRVELYVWEEEKLIALVGSEDGPYCVHYQGTWGGGVRKSIWSARLGEYLDSFFPNSQKLCLEAWYDKASRALLAGERRREEVSFDGRFQRMDLSGLFRGKLLEDGQLKLCCSLPMRVSAARRGGLLELTADRNGPIGCRLGHYTSYLTGEPLARLCGDWETANCWGRACVDGWVVGPGMDRVLQTDPLRHFRGRRAGAAGDRLHALPGLYRSFELGEKRRKLAM